jgi:hypothetical protein
MSYPENTLRKIISQQDEVIFRLVKSYSNLLSMLVSKGIIAPEEGLSLLGDIDGS